MKKTLFFIILTSLLLVTSCKKRESLVGKQLNVVCMVFPEYDWVRSIAGAENESLYISFIEKNGMDMHRFVPIPEDLEKIEKCDLFIYTGGPSDEWVLPVLNKMSQKSDKIINLKEKLGVEDEHIWLSLKNAKNSSQIICDALCTLDPENSETYKSNLKKYTGELELLNQQFEYATSHAQNKTFLFADRFPFTPLFEDFSLEFTAAFPDCTALTEVTDEKIAQLADKLNEINVKYIYTIETSDEKLPGAIQKAAHNYRADVIRLDSMQSTTLRSAINGKTYLKTMQKNLEQLEKGLQ